MFEACVSGLGEESIGNDLLGFSHAVLASGVSAFLGGLWKVSDEASALLMMFLSEELAEGQGRKSLARCWRNAQIRLYRLDTRGAVKVWRNMSKRLKAAEEGEKEETAQKLGTIDKDLARRLRKTMKAVIEDTKADGGNFRHPFFGLPLC